MKKVLALSVALGCCTVLGACESEQRCPCNSKPQQTEPKKCGCNKPKPQTQPQSTKGTEEKKEVIQNNK